MRPFNLAETRIAERTCCKDQIGHRLRLIVILAAVTALVAAVSLEWRTSVREEAIRTRLQLAGAAGRCSRMKREIERIRLKSNQRKWQQSMAHGSDRWIGALHAVLGCVPDDMWLSRVESSESTSSLMVEGQASSFASLSRFTSTARTLPEFSEVIMKNTRVTAGKSIAVDFAMQVKLKVASGAQAGGQPAGSSGGLQAQAVPPVQESP